LTQQDAGSTASSFGGYWADCPAPSATAPASVSSSARARIPRITWVAAVGIAASVVVIGAPLAGWFPVVRLPAVLVPALILVMAVMRPWRQRAAVVEALDRWRPGSQLVWSAAVVVGLVLFWIVLTRFNSGQINAVDFTIYFDRPCFQTSLGRPLLVETSDDARFSHRSGLADHAYWGLVPLCSLYAIHPSPMWLLAVSVVAVVVGAVYVGRIVQHLGGGAVLASAAAFAFVLNDNTARTLNYGFHPEVLYAWFIPWMIHAGLRGARKSFLAATLVCILVKEDAFLPVLAVSVALALIRFATMTRADRWVFLVLPTAIGLANLGVHYGHVVPRMAGSGGRPTYVNFWANWGPTPLLALWGIVTHPVRVLTDTMTAGFFRLVLPPFLFLPLVGWRWTLGIVPIVALYSTSGNDQLRAFGIYYAIVLVPFLVVAASSGALTVARRGMGHTACAKVAAAAVVLMGALVVGSGSHGYSLRPWRPEIAAVPSALEALAGDRLVLVQSGLYPHAGYDEHVQLLTRETLNDPRHRGVAVITAPAVGAYPFDAGELSHLGMLQPIRPASNGIVISRISR